MLLEGRCGKWDSCKGMLIRKCIWLMMLFPRNIVMFVQKASYTMTTVYPDSSKKPSAKNQ